MRDFIEQFKDPYERKARVIPALLVALPILVPLVCVYGPQNPVLTAVLGLLGGCGVVYGLASVTRGRGKALEERLVQKWGGLPTKLALRHRDTHFDSVTKKRYHSDIQDKLNIRMPTMEEELSNPAMADDAYTGATWRLRELTRNAKQLLLKENIAYGFHRNMLAMRTAGLFTSILGLAYGMVIAQVFILSPPMLLPENLANPGLSAGMTIAVSLAFLAAWVFYFDEDKVRRIGFAYAERLFEQLSSLPTLGEKKRSSRTKNVHQDIGNA